MQAPPFSGALIASLITLLCDKYPGDVIIHFGKGDTPKKCNISSFIKSNIYKIKNPKPLLGKRRPSLRTGQNCSTSHGSKTADICKLSDHAAPANIAEMLNSPTFPGPCRDPFKTES